MQWQGSCPSCWVSDSAVASKLATALGLTLRDDTRNASLERGVLRFQVLVVHDSKSSRGKSFSVGVLVKSTRGFAGTSWAKALVRLKTQKRICETWGAWLLFKRQCCKAVHYSTDSKIQH
jgi:hypothetical protein